MNFAGSIMNLVATLTLDSDSFDKGLDNAEGKASSFGSKLKGGLTKSVKLLGTGLAATSTAIAGFGVSSVKAGATFDSSMSQVAATMGLTMDEIETQVGSVDTEFGTFNGTLREFAQFMGSNTAFSASQAADALNYMALAGYDAQTSMNMLPNVLNLAAAGGMELATASDMVTDASSALGLSIEETAVMVDQMAKASSKSNTSVSQLGEAFLTIGGTAKNLTGGTNELATALGILADNGIKGSEGGTALRNILLSLTPKSEDAAEAMQSIGMNAYDAEGNMRPLEDIFVDMNAAMANMSTEEKQNTLAAIFNKVDLKSVNALMAGANDEFTELYSHLDDYGVLEQEIDGIADPFMVLGLSASELRKQLQEATSQEEFTMHMTEEFGMSAEQAAYTWDKMRDAAQKSGTRFDELSGYIEDASGAASEMAETQLDNLNGDITLMKSAFEGLQIAVSDKLTPSLREFVQFGSDGLSRLTKGFQSGGLSGAMEAFGSILSDGIAMIMEMLPQVTEAGVSLLSALLEGVTQNLPMIVNTASQILGQLVQALPTLLPMLMEGIAVFWSSVMTELVGLIPGLVPVIVELVQNIGIMLVENLPLLIEGIVALINAITENLPVLISALLPIIVDLIISIGNILIENMPIILEAAIEMLWAVTEGLFSVVGEIFNAIMNVLKNAWDEWIVPAANAVGEFFSGLWDSIVQIFSVVAGWFDENVIQPVVGFFRGLWENVSGFFSGLWEDIKGIWTAVSTWFDENVVQPVTGFFSGMWDGLRNGASDAWEGIKSAFSAVSTWFKDTFQKAWQKVKDVFSTGGKIFSGIKEGIENTFKTVVNAIIRGINTVIAIPFNAINRFLRTLRDISILGLSPFGWISEFIVPQIPLLAKGGVLGRGQVGLLEGNGAEAVVPLEKNKEWIHAVAQDFAGELGGTSVVINVYGAQGQDINELAEVISRKINDAVSRDRRVFA